jgi:hypothetical protein
VLIQGDWNWTDSLYFCCNAIGSVPLCWADHAFTNKLRKVSVDGWISEHQRNSTRKEFKYEGRLPRAICFEKHVCLPTLPCPGILQSILSTFYEKQLPLAKNLQNQSNKGKSVKKKFFCTFEFYFFSNFNTG